MQNSLTGSDLCAHNSYGICSRVPSSSSSFLAARAPQSPTHPRDPRIPRLILMDRCPHHRQQSHLLKAQPRRFKATRASAQTRLLPLQSADRILWHHRVVLHRLPPSESFQVRIRTYRRLLLSVPRCHPILCLFRRPHLISQENLRLPPALQPP